jgi:hypothetical protein
MNDTQASFSQQIQTDQLFWQTMLNSANHLAADELSKALFLQRLFVVLYHVGLLVKETLTGNYYYAKTSSLPLVCYLSHGKNICLSMEKDTFQDFISFLCTGQLVGENNRPFNEVLYVANNKNMAQLKHLLLYKRPTNATSIASTWKNHANVSHEIYVFTWRIANGELSLYMKITKELFGKIHLTITLQGYPHGWQFYSMAPESLPHRLLQQHQAAENQQGKQFLIPHPKIGIKGELTKTELNYISQMPFTFDILAKPPTEHQEAELDSNVLLPLDAFYQQLTSVEAREFFQQFIRMQYKAYKALDITNYIARRDFLNQWIGKMADDQPNSLIKLQRNLLAQNFPPYTIEQQKTIHTQLIDPLLTTVVKELMALIKLL